MKRLALALLVASAQIQAATPPPPTPITISFDKIPLLTFATFAYGDILRQNFAIHPDLVDLPKLVTVHFQGEYDRPKLTAFLKDILEGVGITIEQKRGYLLLRPTVPALAEPPDQEIFFYRAKYRPISLLMDLTASLFETGRFTTQRTVKNPIQQTPDIAQLGAPTPTTSKTSPGQSNKPKTQDSGNSAFAQIDKSDADFFVFKGTQKEVALLQSLLAQIDSPLPEVLVKGMVYEVTTGTKDANAFSVAMDALKGSLAINFSKPVPGNTFTISSQGIDAVFSALSTDTRFKSISNPSLRVQSGGAARFSVGSDVPVLGVAQIDRNGNAIQSVEYKPSGVIFDIKPTIRDNVIDLSISQQLSTFVTTTTGVNNSPTLIKREISTNVGAVDGDVILLGGLDEDKTNADTNGLSFLPTWTKGKSNETNKTQILLILQVQKI